MTNRTFYRKLPCGATVIFLCLIWGSVLARTTQENKQADFIIRGGEIYTGTNSPPITGDLAIRHDKIVYVGLTKENTFHAETIIRADGNLVIPGFIDPHTHPDAFLEAFDPNARLNMPWLKQGVTTVIVGVDGGGPPGFETNLSGFFSRLTRKRFGTNVATHVGFGAIWEAVIGKENRRPTAEEMKSMKELLVQGICEGGIGFSTGLFYAPQSYATTEDVIALAQTASKYGVVYDTHQRDESSYTIGLLSSVREALDIGRAAKIPVHFAHIKALGVDAHGKASEVVEIVNNARADGLRVTADQYPWRASGSSLEAALLPRWAVDGGREALLRRLSDKATRTRIATEMRDNLRRRGGTNSLLFRNWDAPWFGKRLGEVAREWGKSPIDAAISIIQKGEKTDVISFNMTEEDINTFMMQPWVITSSDGSEGHPRMYASYPQKYTKYVKGKGIIDLGEFISQSTGKVADIFKLDRRGYLREGYFADVAVIELEQYVPKATYLQPFHYAEGVKFLFVNGTLAIKEGRDTGNLAGRGVKNSSARELCEKEK